MNLFKRLLAASGAAGLLIGLGGATQAFATTPFSATILSDCVLVGQSQTITVQSGAAALVHIEVTIDGSTTNGGTQNGTGVTDASGKFSDQWTIAAVSQLTTATIRVWVLAAVGASTGHQDFQIHPASSPCPTTASLSFFGTEIDTQQAGGDVKKTCDAGVSGNAVFTPTIHVKVSYDSALATTFTLPASLSLTLACNGTSKALPTLPVTSTITLHESTLPAGAAVAADTNITIVASPAPTTIHNTKAAVIVPVLPKTGQPTPTPTVPWPGVVVLGLLLVGAGARLIVARRTH